MFLSIFSSLTWVPKDDVLLDIKESPLLTSAKSDLFMLTAVGLEEPRNGTDDTYGDDAKKMKPTADTFRSNELAVVRE